MRLTLEQLIPKYQGSLYRAAFAVCKNREEAEDAVQDTFLRYYRSRREFDGEEHLKAWLLRVCINRARDFTRSFWRRNRESIEDWTESLTSPEPENSRVLAAVFRLPERQRTAVFLFYYEGYSVKETGAILGAGENTVKSWLHRARAQLKQQLQEGWQDEER